MRHQLGVRHVQFVGSDGVKGVGHMCSNRVLQCADVLGAPLMRPLKVQHLDR